MLKEGKGMMGEGFGWGRAVGGWAKRGGVACYWVPGRGLVGLMQHQILKGTGYTDGSSL